MIDWENIKKTTKSMARRCWQGKDTFTQVEKLVGGKNMEEKTCKTCGYRCNSLCDECKFYDGVECHHQADECRECSRGQNWIPEN